MKFAMRCGALVTASLLVSACGESGENAAPVENTAAVADMIAAGEYEVKTKVTSLDVTEGTKADSQLAMDSETSTKVCVGDDGVIPAEAFAEPGDNCTSESPYAKRGKLRITMRCIRPSKGEVGLQVSGQVEGDGMTGEIDTSSYLVDGGDYRMKRSFTATPTGACNA